MPLSKPANFIEVEKVFVRPRALHPPSPTAADNIEQSPSNGNCCLATSPILCLIRRVLRRSQAAFVRACEAHPPQSTWAVDETLPADWSGWGPAASIAGLAACDRGAELVQDAVRLTSLWQRVAVESSPEHSARLQAQLLTDLQIFLDRLPRSRLRRRPLPLAAVSNGPMSATVQPPRQQDGGGQPGRHIGAPRHTTRHVPGTGRSPQQPAAGPAAAPAAAPRQFYPAPARAQHAVLASLLPAVTVGLRPSPAQRKLADLVPAHVPSPTAAGPQTGAAPRTAAPPVAPQLRDLVLAFRVRTELPQTCLAGFSGLPAS
jgi:hypothetical protein